MKRSNENDSMPSSRLLPSTVEIGKRYKLNIDFENDSKVFLLNYSFKPVNIDNQKDGNMVIEGSDVSIQLPIHESQSNYMNFRGSLLESTEKDCQLLFDEETREFKLFRTSYIIPDLKIKETEKPVNKSKASSNISGDKLLTRFIQKTKLTNKNQQKSADKKTLPNTNNQPPKNNIIIPNLIHKNEDSIEKVIAESDNNNKESTLLSDSITNQ